MQATGTLQGARSSKGIILVVVAMLCALLLGAAGGYFARGGSQAAGGSTHSQTYVDANQGSPDSDLTRPLPTAAPAPTVVPDHGLIP